MTSAEVLALAASHGVRVMLALNDLRLEADYEPPAETLAALRDYKEAVVAELRKWRRIFDRHVATVTQLRGLSRLEAERAAFEKTIIEYLNTTFLDTDPNYCAHCGVREQPGRVLQPIGWDFRRAWLHADCWEPWRERRRAQAITELKAMGIEAPAKAAQKESDHG